MESRRKTAKEILKSCDLYDLCGYLESGGTEPSRLISAKMSSSRRPSEPREFKNFAEMQSAAKSGSVEGLYALGLAYKEGVDCQKDLKQAFGFFAQAANKKHPGARLQLSYCYLHGLGVSPNKRDAWRWCNRAARDPYGEAQYAFACCHRDSIGVPMNYRLAMQWFVESAKQGYRKAQDFIGSPCPSDLAGIEDPFERFRCVLTLSTTNNPEAQYELGLFLLGKSLQRANPKAAAEFFLLAAEGGHVKAMETLVQSYQKGKSRGVEKSIVDALHWSIRGAAHKSAFAALQAGLIYKSGGKGVPKDHSNAAKYFDQAISLGSAEASFHLGELYRDGHGVPKDLGKAANYFERAAKAGVPEAQCRLAECHLNGYGCPQDDAKAFEWYALSAQSGDIEAQCCLGQLYASGRGCPQSYKEAKKWLGRAASKKHAMANAYLEHLSSQGLL